jgi:cell division protein FtsQ
VSTPKKRKYGLLILLATLVGLIAFANVWKSSLKVAHVTLTGNRIVDANELFQLASVKHGSLIYDIDLKEIQKNLLSHYYIKDVIVERNLPSTIQLTVEERTPIALVNRSDAVYLDEEGVILPHSISKALFDLPVLTGVKLGPQISYGAIVQDSDAHEALKILTIARLVNSELYHLISEIELRNGHDIVMYTAEGGVPVIVGEGNIVDKLARLDAFWNDVIRQRGLQTLQYVDLRYDDQVVARWSNRPRMMKTM